MAYINIGILSALVEEVGELLDAIPLKRQMPPENPIIDKHNPSKRAKSYYREIIKQYNLLCVIFGLAGDLKHFDFILEIMLDGFMGIIFLVDQRHTESYEDSKAYLTLLRSYALTTPIIVVDIDPASDPNFMRAQLELLEGEQLLNCNVNDLNSIKNVILTLVRLIPDYAENQDLLTALNQL